ncbi:MAG: nucleoside kinase, partial [Spirochaetales bacterium]|nr:nucleoside kinase [Spirochaetales bacterium]
MQSLEITIHLSSSYTETWKAYPGQAFLSWIIEHPKLIPTSVLGIIVHNHIEDLRTPLSTSCEIVPIGPGHPEYSRLFQQNLTSLFFAAARSLEPQRQWKLGHSMGNGLFLEPHHFLPTPEMILEIANKMSKYCAEALPFSLETLDYRSAIAALSERSGTTVLDSMNDAVLSVTHIDGYRELTLGPLALNASSLVPFSLEPYSEGALLRYPAEFSVNRGSKIPEFLDIPFLSHIYKEHQRWSRILGVRTIGTLNHVTQTKSIKEYIWTAEALQAGKINEIAQEIGHKAEALRAILIAGPSSSGKTTFAKRLSIQLQAQGIKPKALSLDNFFLPRENTPRDEYGNYDFETLRALDLELLNETILGLMNGEMVALPVFDFRVGDRYFPHSPEKLEKDEILVIEGIHGLNPELLLRIPKENIHKIYISALTQINVDQSHRISTTDNRLVRRIVRDYRYRGHAAGATLEMWSSVRRGEDVWIYPYQTLADAQFNSALDYELGVLKPMAESLLRQVKPDQPSYTSAKRLLQILGYF